MSDELGRCGLTAPCQVMRNHLRDGGVLRDYAGSLRLGDGTLLQSCPWCSSYVAITPELVERWDDGATPQADGTP